MTVESAPHGSASESTFRITSCRRGAVLRGFVLQISCLSQVHEIAVQCFARASHVLPSWSASVNEVALQHAHRGQQYRGKAHTRSGARLVRNPYWTPPRRDVHHENKVLRNWCAERGRPSRASKQVPHTHAQPLSPQVTAESACVGTHIKNHVVPSRSNTTAPCTSKFMRSQQNHITMVC